MDLDTSFPVRLRWAMEIRTPPCTQTELARHIGVSPQSVQQWASGATATPRREKLQAAADYLGVRFDWLAYARGLMRETDSPAAPPAAQATETALLGREWEQALQAALPDSQHDNLHARVEHPSGATRFRVDYLDATVLAMLGLYRTPAGLIRARERLWQLVVARELLGPVPGRRTLFIAAPLTEGGEVPERHLEALRVEARLLGVELHHARTPVDAAALLLGRTEAPVVPLDDALGLDTSPVL
jgi:transcriptional regulator with XRE-family HTH domain